MISKAAVIVTTYNSKSSLRRVLDAYRKQRTLPAELIVADDGSTDGTDEAVASAAAESEFPIHHVWHENKGFRAGSIRNEAVRKSTADYLIFTDGDCIPHPNFVADHCRIARKGSFVQGRRVLVGEKATDSFVWKPLPKLMPQCLKGEITGWYLILPVPGFSLVKKGLRGIKTCNLALHAEDFAAVNGFNEDFVGWGREDSELAVRLMKYGLLRRDALFCAQVFHLWHPNNARDALSRNDELLKAAMESDEYRCTNGLERL